jgi:ribosomal protein S18 acetylase RimI-like enzyme
MTRATISYRRARAEDAERTFEVVREAADDLLRRNGRDPSGGHGLPLPRVIRFRHGCVRHDPDRFWVAEADGVIVGAAIAVLRDDVWYLAGLHVVPALQGVGVGTELIRRSLAGTGPDTALTVLTDALNPDSNGLYVRHGMLPQDSTWTFDGPIGAGETLGATLTARPIDPVADLPGLERLDRATVGFGRPMDHEFWAGVPGLAGRLVMAGTEVTGYLYASDGGAIGPVAVADPTDLPAALDLAAATALELGAPGLHLRAFGSAHGAIRWAGDRGLRLTGLGMMLSSRPVGRFTGYVTSGADALY